MISVEDVEYLKTIFQPKSEFVTHLPKIKEVRDKVFVTVQEKGQKSLYQAVNGEFFLIRQGASQGNITVNGLALASISFSYSNFPSTLSLFSILPGYTITNINVLLTSEFDIGGLIIKDSNKEFIRSDNLSLEVVNKNIFSNKTKKYTAPDSLVASFTGAPTTGAGYIYVQLTNA